MLCRIVGSTEQDIAVTRHPPKSLPTWGYRLPGWGRGRAVNLLLEHENYGEKCSGEGGKRVLGLVVLK